MIISPPTSQTSDDTFDLITSRFVTRNNGNDSLYLDTFYGANEQFSSEATLFPNKFTDLDGRILRLALFNYKPYTIWDEVVRMMIIKMCYFIITKIIFFSLQAPGMLMQLDQMRKKLF